MEENAQTKNKPGKVEKLIFACLGFWGLEKILRGFPCSTVYTSKYWRVLKTEETWKT